MSLIHDVLTLLADGDRHSGVALAARLGVSRAAVSKAVALLPDVPISVTRGGYALPAAFRPLESARIRGWLQEKGCVVEELDLREEVDSTNRVLLAGSREGVCVCAAERQTAGRGRRGRQWQASPYGNVMVSVSWVLRANTHSLGVLSLGAGVGVLRALRGLGVDGAALKWPNDVLWRGRKLAGILIEMRGETEAMRVVIGVGVNGTLGPEAGSRVDQAWVDLSAVVGAVDRDQVVAGLVVELDRVMTAYREGHVAPLLHEWRAHHAWVGLRVRMEEPGRPEAVGTVVDVNDEGLLILEVGGARRLVCSGEVTMRPL